MLKVREPSTTEDDTEEEQNEKKARTFGLITQDILVYWSSVEPTDLISFNTILCFHFLTMASEHFVFMLLLLQKYQRIDLNPKMYPLEG